MRWVEISISAVWLFCWKYMTLGYQSYHWTMHNFIADVRRGEIWENWSRKQFAFFHGRTEKGTKSNIFAYKLCAWKLLVVMYRSNRSFNMPPPPGHTPGIWHLWHLCRPGEEGIWLSESSRGWGIWSPCFRDGEFELRPRFHIKSLAWRAMMGDAVLEDFGGNDCAFVANWLQGKGFNKLCAVFEVFKF